MLRKLAVVLLVLGAVSPVYAGIYMLPNAGASNGNSAVSVAAVSGGTAYVSGQARVDDGLGGYVLRGGYWTYSNGAISAFNVTPPNAGGTISSNSLGIGVLGDGNVVVGGVQPGSGAATYVASNPTNNGWLVHFLPSGGGQATTPNDQNLIRVADNGTSFYALAKSSSGDMVGSWLVDTANGWTQTLDSFGGITSGATAQGISANGVAVGTQGNYAFIHNPGQNIQNLAHPDGGDRSYGYDISKDGKTAVGMTRWPGDKYYGAYWTESGGTWTAQWLDVVPGATSTEVAYAVNEDGSLIGGYGYCDGTGRAALWDPNDLNVYGQPTAILLEDYLASYGITDLAGFASLNKVLSISTVGARTYISGIGTDSVGATKGFLVVVPEPATLSFLALGGLALLRRRH